MFQERMYCLLIIKIERNILQNKWSTKWSTLQTDALR